MAITFNIKIIANFFISLLTFKKPKIEMPEKVEIVDLNEEKESIVDEDKIE